MKRASKFASELPEPLAEFAILPPAITAVVVPPVAMVAVANLLDGAAFTGAGLQHR